MSKKHNHIEKLTPELLKAYKNGELTSAEEHEVERLLLDDPFYEDALEGMESLASYEYEEDLQTLEKRLDARLAGEEKRKAIFWKFNWRVAASILIIFSLTFVFIWFQDNTDKIDSQETAQKEQVTSQKDSISLIEPKPLSTLQLANTEKEKPANMSLSQPQSNLSTLADVELAEIVFEADEEEKTEIAKVEPQTINLEGEIGKVIETQIAEIKVKKLEESISQTLQGKVAGIQIENRRSRSAFMDTTTAANRLTAMASPSKKTDNALAKNIIIQVVDAEDELPLPAVTIIRKGTSEGTPTDMNGYAQILVKEPVTLIAKYLGYVTQEFEIHPSLDSLNIKLQPDLTELSEVVVTAYDPGMSVTDDTYSAALPEGGMKAFKAYIEDSLQYPEAAKTANIKGTVVVKFTINPNGTLSYFEIRKSVGFGCDEEAIRLIKEGPSWKAAKRRNTFISSPKRVRIKFKP